MNRTVLITGVSGGIGASLLRCFKDAGWTAAGIDIKGEGTHCDFFLQGDISDPEFVRSAVKSISLKYSALHGLINNAAVEVDKTLIETAEDEWDRVFRTNVYAIYYISKYFIDLLDNAAIINISSVHARATSKGVAAYAASKGAISALTRAMALELADRGIRVNAILPGAIETPMLKKGLQRNVNAEEARKRLVESTPLKKVGRPDDVARLAVFLADNCSAGNITGQEFVCDGGVLARLASE